MFILRLTSNNRLMSSNAPTLLERFLFIWTVAFMIIYFDIAFTIFEITMPEDFFFNMLIIFVPASVVVAAI